MLQMRFDDQAALVTGGAGGCGGAVAMALAELGADVVVADLDGAAAEAMADRIRSEGGRATAHQVDVSRRDSVSALFARLGDGSRPPLDILVTAAGAIRYGSILEQSEQDVGLVVDVNVKGTYYCIQESARVMAPNGRGVIVNFASTAAFVATRLSAAAYGMSKGAIRQLTIAAAVELAPHGIRVNAVAPGTIPTQFTQDTLQTEEQIARAASAVPLGRLGTVDDVVGPTVFLCSPLASYITGQVLAVDGGKLGRAG